MQPQTGTGKDESAIRSVLDGVSKAIHDRDAQRAVSFYAEGTVLYSLAPPLVADTSDPSGLDQWFATWSSPITITHRDLSIAVDGDIAFAHGLANMVGTKVGGRRNDLWYRHTTGLRRLDGKWKIIHEHESVPFLMDGSGLAALDLKP